MFDVLTECVFVCVCVCLAWFTIAKVACINKNILFGSKYMSVAGFLSIKYVLYHDNMNQHFYIILHTFKDHIYNNICANIRYIVVFDFDMEGIIEYV